MKKNLFISILLLSFSFLPSQSKTESEPKPAYGGHLTIGDFSPINIINPIISTNGTTAYLVHLIFNGLVKSDENFKIVPDLAYKWDRSKGGLVWKFYLRKGVKFHDGTELTSEDVKFTYDLIKNSKYRGSYTIYFEPVEQINIIDRYTLEIILIRPYSSFLSGLSAGILPRHFYSGKDLLDLEVNQYPVGTGPFKVLSNSAPDKMILEANKDYFENRPFLDRVTLKIFKDQNSLLAKMIDGSIDAVITADTENIDILKRISSFKLYRYLNPFYYILAFQNKGVFRDSRVRIALNYAINKNALLKKVLNNQGIISSGPVFPKMWVSNKQINPYSYNPAKSISLLKQAGWMDSNNNHILDKDGIEFDFTVFLVGGKILEELTLRQIKLDLNKIGISMKTKKYPLKLINHFLMQKKFEAVLFSMSGREDHDSNFKFWHSSQIEKGLNVFSYKNAKVDKYLNNKRLAFGFDLRKRYYYRFQEEIYNDPPGIFLFWTYNFSLVHKKFKGIKMHPNWINDLKNWYIPEKEQRTWTKENSAKKKKIPIKILGKKAKKLAMHVTY